LRFAYASAYRICSLEAGNRLRQRAAKAIEARKHWLTVEWLPKYAPELNDIEVVWHDLKAHHLAHQTFADADALERAIHAAVAALNQERTVNPLAIQRISAMKIEWQTAAPCAWRISQGRAVSFSSIMARRCRRWLAA